MLPDIEIIVGTYEEFLLGYQLTKQGEDDIFSLKQTFADKAHAGPIKSLAVGGKFIASGGNDDRIYIYDMGLRKLDHVLLSHSGTVNALAFSPDLTHMLSCSSDGHFIAIKLQNWKPEGDWIKSHGGAAITNIACHPSGKLAFTMGADNCLNTWNLVTGRVVFRTKLQAIDLRPPFDNLSICPSGDYFSMTGQFAIGFWEVNGAKIIRCDKLKSKPICVTWLNNKTCLAGLENGNILWFNLDDAPETAPKTLEAHDARVKAMVAFNNILVSICSAGKMHVWRWNIDEKDLTKLSSTNIGCRPTCMAILDLSLPGVLRPALTGAVKTVDKATTEKPKTSLPKPRGYVTVEIDEDAQNETLNSSDEEEEVSNKKEQGKKKASDSDTEQLSEDDLNSGDELSGDSVAEFTDSDSEDDDDSFSESDNELPRPKRKQANLEPSPTPLKKKKK